MSDEHTAWKLADAFAVLTPFIMMFFPVWYIFLLFTGRASPVDHWLSAFVLFVFVAGEAKKQFRRI